MMPWAVCGIKEKYTRVDFLEKLKSWVKDKTRLFYSSEISEDCGGQGLIAPVENVRESDWHTPVMYRFSVIALQKKKNLFRHDITAASRFVEFGSSMRHSGGSGIQKMRKQWHKEQKTKKSPQQARLSSRMPVILQHCVERLPTKERSGRKGVNTKQHLLTNTSHVPALFHTTMHIQAPPIPVCIAPKCPASFFSKPGFHQRDSALLIHILLCLLSLPLLFFAPDSQKYST